MSDASNDKLQTCVSFIVQQLQRRDLHSNSKGSSPFFLGINGVQGIGKTSLVSPLSILMVIHIQKAPSADLSSAEVYDLRPHHYHFARHCVRKLSDSRAKTEPSCWVDVLMF